MCSVIFGCDTLIQTVVTLDNHKIIEAMSATQLVLNKSCCAVSSYASILPSNQEIPKIGSIKFVKPHAKDRV